MTGATGKRYLRSPGVHHVDLHPYALRRFAKKGAGKRLARFVYPYDRPGLEFFRAHTEHVVREHGLNSLRERCRATAISLARSRRRGPRPCGGVMEAGNYGPDVKQDSAPSR